MNEYNDAIQRLEISERPAGTTIRRSIFPIPRKNTPWNYNYIFRTTGNMNIPKYSIPQHLILCNHNAKCVATQKSQLNTLVEAIQQEISSVETSISDTKADISSHEALYELHLSANNQTSANSELEQINTLKVTLNEYEIELNRLKGQLDEYNEQLEELANDAKTVFDFPLDQQFTLAQGNRKSIAIRTINIEACEYELDEISMTDDVAFVASTINPWSKNNIIGGATQTFQGMPRMFPWDNQQHITIWFLNSYGRIVESPCIKGVIDLELIIDNENTFSYE